MRGENAGVLDAMSDVSDSSVDSDVEFLHVLDPSDPRAHQAAHKPLAVQPTREMRKAEKVAAAGNGGSRWDSDGPDPADDDDEDVGERVTIVIDDDDDDDDEQQTPQQRRLPEETATEPKKTVVTLSKWAQARFLVPSSERKLPVLEDPPLEPLNDFILSDFGSRFRGETGAVDVERQREPCDICGHTGHENEDCENVGRRDVTCMVCTEVGHLHCVPVPPPADRRVYCPHCAGNHSLQDCRSSGNSNGRHVSGRKRGRDVDEEYPDYNGYDYDDEEDNYVHGSSSSKKSRSRGKSSSGYNERSRKSSNHQSSAYPRLNEALPTRPYRNSNSSNGDGERKRQRRR
ncbi:hypothetical protein BBJ28_00005087 [Nothophytophthora sp. Chile5]|nr:hypothetical protein BBJ28_00005087 [Nothophytophthora sp. Chile5]